VAPSGAVEVAIQQSTAAFDGFMLDSGGVLPGTVEDLIERPIGDTLAGIIAALVGDELPARLKTLVGGEQRVSVGGQTLAIALTPTELHVDAMGLDVALDSKIYVPGQSGLSFVMRGDGDGAPRLDATRPFRAAVSDDAVNQALTALWGAGLMDRAFPVDAGDYAGLGKLFDTVEVALRLPPVLTALPGNRGLVVAVGDVDCRFLRAGAVVTRLGISAQAAVTSSVRDNKLGLGVARPEVYLEVLSEGVTGANPLDHDSVERLASFAATAALGLATSYVAAVPLPSVDGIQIANAEISTGVASGGYVLVAAELR